MKKIFAFAATLVIGFSAVSCLVDEPTTPGVIPADEVITVSRSLGIATRSGEEITLTASMNLGSESITDYNLSDAFYQETGLTSDLLDQILQIEMGTTYDLQSDAATRGPHADCISGCISTFAKGEGRGSCKLGCWVDTVLTFVKELLDLPYIEVADGPIEIPGTSLSGATLEILSGVKVLNTL